MTPHWWRSGRFAVLLTTLVAMILVFPLMPENAASAVALRVFHTAIIGSGLWVLEQNPRLARVGRVLGLLALASTWSGLVIDTLWFYAAVRGLLSAFFILTTWQLVLYLARARTADTNTVLASVCGYLMIGFVFALVYEVVENHAPGAFALTQPENFSDFGELAYFSFVTLTTLGYGDVTPVHAFARSAAILEAVIGQFYVAIIVARLISLVVSSSRARA